MIGNPNNTTTKHTEVKMNKQSSVDYLISQLQKSKDWHRVLNEVSQMSSVRVDIITESKAREKKQCVDFALKCMLNGLEPHQSTREVIEKLFDEGLQ
jgi:hypothetical protein